MSATEASISTPNLDTGITPSIPDSGSGGITGSLPSDHKPSEREIIDSFNTENKDNVNPDPITPTEDSTTKDPITEPVDVKDPDATPEVTGNEDDIIVPIEDISVAKVHQYIKDIPELKTAFDKNPNVKNAIFAMARRSSRLDEFVSILPTPESAKFAADNSEAFMNLNDMFFDEKPESHVGFWNQLYENSLLRDPVSGELVLDKASNRPVSTGAYERVCSSYRGAVYSELEQKASYVARQNLEQATEIRNAIALVKELCGDGKRQQSIEAEPKLTPEQQRRLDEADLIKQELNQSKSQRQIEFNTSISEGITTTLQDDIKTHVKRIVDTQGVALTPYEQSNVVKDIFSEIDKLAAANKQYQTHFNSLLKKAPPTEAGRKSIIAEARKYAKEVLPQAALKIIREATSSVADKAKQKDDKRASHSSKTEIQTSGSAPSPTTSTDIKGKAIEEVKRLKRGLTEDEIMALR